LRRCGIFKSCVSPSKLEKPSVPKWPSAGLSAWQPWQVCSVSDVTLMKKFLPVCCAVVSELSSARMGLGGSITWSMNSANACMAPSEIPTQSWPVGQLAAP